MARCRGIKPGFFTNELLPELGPHAHLLFAGLWVIADREGRLEDRPKRIKAECMPHYDVDIDALLDALAAGPDPFIQRYSVAQQHDFDAQQHDFKAVRKFIQILHWNKHQTPHHTEKESVIPASPLVNGEFTVSARPTREMHTIEVNSKQLTVNSKQQTVSPSRKFNPPTVEEVADYCRERGNAVDADEFVNFYTAKGWKIGKNSMVDWKAAVRNWEKNAKAKVSSVNDPRNVASSLAAFLAKGKNKHG